MIHWLTANKLRDEDRSQLHPIQTTYQALLSSTIADGDMITDWLYYFEIFRSDEDISQWLITLQLVSCIFGTLAWLSVATDGRLVYLMKVMLIWLILTPIFIVSLIILILNEFLIKPCLGEQNKAYKGISDMMEWTHENVIIPIRENESHKPTFSSSTLLFFGIVFEDIPQVVVTFLIEDKIRSDDPAGRISEAAMLNLVFAIFDILHKIAEALDLLSDVHNAGYAYKKWVKAHSHEVYSLLAAGGNRILSASFSYIASEDNYKIIKLWDTAKGKFKAILKFKCESYIIDMVTVGTSKVMAACVDRKIRVFDFETGDFLGAPIELDFVPNFISLSHDSTSVLTSSSKAPMIQSFDIETNECLFTYDQGATALSFLDDSTFVTSSSKYPDNIFVWKINNNKPIHTIELELPQKYLEFCNPYCHAVMAMSPTAFLIGKGYSIKVFEFANNQWICKSTFNEHTEDITSLTKVNESLFVSTSKDKTARLWDINNDLPCILTFLGHTTNIYSSVYLEEEKAIATGDENGNIAVWSIAKYLDNDRVESENEIRESRTFFPNTSDIDNSDQNITGTEP